MLHGELATNVTAIDGFVPSVDSDVLSTINRAARSVDSGVKTN